MEFGKNNLKVWNSKTGKLIANLVGHPKSANVIALVAMEKCFFLPELRHGRPERM